jgi:predicted amidohydrolase
LKALTPGADVAAEGAMSVVISLGQMDVQLGEPEQNLAKVEEWTAEAARRGSQLVVFPELWSTGYDLENVANHATRLTEGMFARMGSLARQYAIGIYGSCLSELGEGRYGNTAVLYGSDGQLLGTYTKLHLFRLMQEDRYLIGGQQLTLANTAWAKVGLSICYDLRFPELFRAYALAGAQAMLVCAEWPNPRLAHWQTLLVARAIENQAFVIACNRVGESRGVSFFGHSCVVDPWGEFVANAGGAEGLVTVAFDPDQVAAVRQQIPVFQDRRPEVYGPP